MKVLVTGGAGFIGRWLVKRLLEDGHDVWVLDLSNGGQKTLKSLKDILDLRILKMAILKMRTCLMIISQIILIFVIIWQRVLTYKTVLDAPRTTFENDVTGTFNVLEQCKKHGTKIVFMSTCMVYDRAHEETGITERHPVKPASPYAGSKIAGENMVLSYWYAYLAGS